MFKEEIDLDEIEKDPVFGGYQNLPRGIPNQPRKDKEEEDHSNREGDTAEAEKGEKEERRLKSLYTSYSEAPIFEEERIKNVQSKDGCTWKNLMSKLNNMMAVAILCLGVGMFFLVIGILISTSVIKYYKTGTCFVDSGTVLKAHCLTNNDKVDCWNLYEYISAVPNVKVSFFIKTFYDWTEANSTLANDVGKSIGTCYYKDGGATIVFHLSFTNGLIVSGVILIVAAFIFAFFMAFVHEDREGKWYIGMKNGVKYDCCCSKKGRCFNPVYDERGKYDEQNSETKKKREEYLDF